MKFCLHLCLAKPVKIAGCFQPELPIKDGQRGKIKVPLFTQTWFLQPGFAKRVNITSNFKPIMSIKKHNEVKSRFHYPPNLCFWI